MESILPGGEFAGGFGHGLSNLAHLAVFEEIDAASQLFAGVGERLRGCGDIFGAGEGVETGLHLTHGFVEIGDEVIEQVGFAWAEFEFAHTGGVG